MLLIWKGRGILIVLILIICFVVQEYVVPDMANDTKIVVAFFTAALFSWYFGNLWNNTNGRELIDPHTGNRVILRNGHSLFFIKMQYWGPILAIAGLTFLAKSAVWSWVVSAIFLGLYGILAYRKRKSTKRTDRTKPKLVPQKPKSVNYDDGPLKQVRKQQPVAQSPVTEIMDREDHRRFMPR